MAKNKVGVTLMMIAMLAVVAFGVYWLFCRHNYELTDEGQRLKAGLGLVDFRGPTDRYTWTCPSSVTVSNQTFKIVNDSCDKQSVVSSWSFNLRTQSGVEIGRCELYVYSSPEEAINRFCDSRARSSCVGRIIKMPNGEDVLVSFWQFHVIRDEWGCILLPRCDARCPDRNFSEIKWNGSDLYRLYANLWIKVSINIERTTLNAKDFALPLLEAGASKR